MRPGRRPVRADLRNVALLLVAVALLWAPRLRGPIDLRYDGGVYYLLGTSLAEGRGYRLLNEPGAIESVQYPPLLPAIVAGTERLLRTSDSVVAGHALRLLFCALSLAYAAAVYALARAFVGPGLALLAGGLTVLHHFTFFLSDLCFAEIPFALVTVLFVIAARGGATSVAGVLGAAAVLLRTQGVVLLGAWVGDAVLRRRGAQAVARAALSLVPLLLWGGYVELVTHRPDYDRGAYAYQRAAYQYYNVTYLENLRLADPFRPEAGRLSAAGLASRVAGNLARAPLRFGEAVSATWGDWEQAGWWLGRPVRLALTLEDSTRVPRLLLGLAALAGLVWLAVRREWLVVLYVVGSYLVVALLPWPAQFARYLAPLAPFLALALACTLHWLRGERASGASLTAARIAAAVLVLLALAVQAWAIGVTYGRYLTPATYVDSSGSRAEVRLFYHGPEWDAFDDALDWLRANAAPGAVVATSCPHLAFLRTGHLAVMPPMERDPELAQRLLDSVPASYVVVDRLDFTDVSRRYAAPAVQRRGAPWDLAYDRAGVRVYRRRAPRS